MCPRVLSPVRNPSHSYMFMESFTSAKCRERSTCTACRASHNGAVNSVAQPRTAFTYVQLVHGQERGDDRGTKCAPRRLKQETTKLPELLARHLTCQSVHISMLERTAGLASHWILA